MSNDLDFLIEKLRKSAQKAHRKRINNPKTKEAFVKAIVGEGDTPTFLSSVNIREEDLENLENLEVVSTSGENNE